MERYYYAETTGWLTAESAGTRELAGVTAMVLDRGNLHRPVVLIRSEDVAEGNAGGKRKTARRRAERACAQLNAGLVTPDPNYDHLPHGTFARYRYGRCRCTPCTNANRVKCLAYRRRRRARLR